MYVDVTSLSVLIDLTFKAKFYLMFDCEGASFHRRRDQFLDAIYVVDLLFLFFFLDRVNEFHSYTWPNWPYTCGIPKRWKIYWRAWFSNSAHSSIQKGTFLCAPKESKGPELLLNGKKSTIVLQKLSYFCPSKQPTLMQVEQNARPFVSSSFSHFSN